MKEQPISAQIQKMTDAFKMLSDMVQEFTHGALNPRTSNGLQWVRLAREEYKMECVAEGWSVFRVHIEYDAQKPGWKYFATRQFGGGVEGYKWSLSDAKSTAIECVKFGYENRAMTISGRPEPTKAEILEMIRSEDRRLLKSEVGDFMEAGLSLSEEEQTNTMD